MCRNGNKIAKKQRGYPTLGYSEVLRQVKKTISPLPSFHPSRTCGHVSQADAEAQPAGRGRTFSEIRLEMGQKPMLLRASQRGQPASLSLSLSLPLSIPLSLPPFLPASLSPVTTQLVSQTPAARILMVVVRGVICFFFFRIQRASQVQPA